MIGTTEVLLVIAVLVLFFGASKIPELARGVGEGINEFRNAAEKEIDEGNSDDTTNSTSQNEQNNRGEVKQS